VVDAAGEGLDVLKALVAEPHGDGEGALSVVAEDYDGLVGIEFLVSAAGDLAHGHEEGIGETGGLELPRLPDVQEQRCSGLVALLKVGLGGDFGIEHGSRITTGNTGGERYTDSWRASNVYQAP
jgi:hypothetical protein